jgi:hypothetical protein
MYLHILYYGRGLGGSVILGAVAVVIAILQSSYRWGPRVKIDFLFLANFDRFRPE